MMANAVIFPLLFPPPPLATVPVVIVPEGSSACLLRVVSRGNLLGCHDALLCPTPPLCLPCLLSRASRPGS